MDLPVATNQPSFYQTLLRNGLKVTRTFLKILQINVGKLCNQACYHCHVEASPKRTEMMDEETAIRLIELLKHSPQIEEVDITGGAPELNPHFRYLVVESKRLGKTVIDRCNLTVLLETGQEETAGFLREHRVQIVASLPCYSRENVDKQRGIGVFDKSICALQLLNELGYGRKETGLILDLVYNPSGAALPPSQETLESDYKRELKDLFGIDFNHLYTLTNMPIKRFLDNLKKGGQLEEYMSLLVNNFNQQAVLEIMCRHLISIGWDGQIYDCDFNQMLEIPLGQRTLWNIESFDDLITENITFDNHCYGCTAGSGSSCSRSLISNSAKES